MIGYLSSKKSKHIALLLYFFFVCEFFGYASAYKFMGNVRVLENTTLYKPKSRGAKISINELPEKLDSRQNNKERNDLNKYTNSDFSYPSSGLLRKEIAMSSNEPDYLKTDNNISKGLKGNSSISGGGPGQPEMSSFKSIGADNMVNLFTGDLSYSVPLLDAGGYPINLFYSAGITMDQEASWTGLGWNINPGTISRNMRGLPDDFDGSTADRDTIVKVQNIKPDLTVGVNVGLNAELVGLPALQAINAGVFWNNKRGIGLEVGADFSIQKSIAKENETDKTNKDTIGSLGLSASLNLNSQNGLSVKAGLDVNLIKGGNSLLNGLSTSVDYNSRQGINELQITAESNLYKKISGSYGFGLLPNKLGTSISFARPSYTPGIRMPLTRFNANVKVKMGTEASVFFPNGSISGSLSNAYISEKDMVQVKPAYGYIYYEKANLDKEALLDFNRINDGTYTLKTPIISIPNYTYDIFSINGEGTGGSFRAYRGNIGYVRDNLTQSRDGAFSLTVDAGVGFLFHGGTELGGVYTKTKIDEWKENNILRNAVKFQNSDGLFEGVYLKNPGEKAIIDQEYYNSTAGDNLIRPSLGNNKLPLPSVKNAYEVFSNQKRFQSEKLVNENNTKRQTRDKRTQIISYLTAEEADRVGLDTKIYSYQENVFKPSNCYDLNYRTPIRRYNPGDPSYYRKAHHLSEVDVLESDGKRYIYGIPAYTKMQKEVSFSLNANQGNRNTQRVIYEGAGLNYDGQNSVDNKSGKDWFFQSEAIPAYAHSFLLSAILSPDYVDVNGDGISDDDIGTAVKFNYTRVNKKTRNSWAMQKWRIPFNSYEANYNEGLKTDNADDKGLYTYGEKELWYVHSIQTKTMVVTFTLSDRRDAKQVSGENGGISYINGQRKLERIDLYTKAEFLKASPVPIKTVHFSYNYSLCGNVPNNDGGAEFVNGVNINQNRGKLTLESIWFSYNGNNRQVKNKYIFKYSQGRNNITGNPNYDYAKSDRWGTYKNNSISSSGLSGITNGDFPFVLQNYSDTMKTNVFASAWNLEQVLLPSGALINIKYEADDYAYVQNRRAAQMTKIAGFAKSSTALPSYNLYDYTLANVTNPGSADASFVFFDVGESVGSREDIYDKYLEGLKQLLLKVWVEMPSNSYGSGYEGINVYATIKNYGLVSGNSNRFWVELDKSKSGGSQIMETVIQYLKDFHPSKAFKGFDVGNQSGLRQIVSAVQGLGSNLIQAAAGFENILKSKGQCKKVDANYSFARLNNPLAKKLGGGHRVKSIVISDNWKRMRNSIDNIESYYGQIYDYDKDEILNGVSTKISSGVATYEPGIGNEENPFREVLKYREKQPLGPTNVSNIEMPITESFFPSPVVGYSKVSVRSISNKETKNIKSGVGTQVTEFYTSKDFPVLSDYTDFDSRSRVHHKSKGILRILFNKQDDFLTLSQGFRVQLNDMNGKIKAQKMYSENDLKNPINSTMYYYKQKKISDKSLQLENNVDVVSGSDGIVQTKVIGQDIEIMNDFRSHYSSTRSSQIPLNKETFLAGPFFVIIPSVLSAVFADVSMYRSATTLKVVNQFGILDSVINIDKGSVVKTENILYDGETGEVLVTKTKNEFNTPIFNLNYPAHWVNSGMDLAYKNINATYKNVKFISGIISNSPQVNMAVFESGDEIYVEDFSMVGPLNPDACYSLGQARLLPQSTENRIWAVNINKDARNPNSSFVFIDRKGNLYNANDATIRIIRSGKRNMGNVSVGNITSIENPIQTIGDTRKILVSNTTKILNAGVVEFKEKWRTQDAFYSVDTTIQVITTIPLQTAYLPYQSGYTVGEQHNGGSRTNNVKWNLLSNPPFFLGKYSFEGRRLRYKNDWTRDRSWLLFDFSSLPQNATIVEAKLNLHAHSHNKYVPGNFRHNFLYASVDFGSHGEGDPHRQVASQATSNFRISRTEYQLPATGDLDGWKSRYFNDGSSGFASEKFFSGPGPYNLNKSYVGQEALELTEIVRAMHQDKWNPQKSYPTALKINMVNDNIAENLPASNQTRVCFATQDYGGKPFGKPYILVKYFNCNSVNQRTSYKAISPDSAQCIVEQTGSFCFSVFSRAKINPYVYGLLGNWRPSKSFVYYGEKEQSDPTISTDISKDGVIKNFENYWVTGSSRLQRSGSSKWTWNSEISQYNRKGLEIENHDPLERFNSGVYGYQESLPIATANNARVREIGFDGFEDYFYKDQLCDVICKPSYRHLNFGNISTLLSTTQHHSGKYSLGIQPNSNYSFTTKIVANSFQTEPDIRINELVSNSVDTAVSLKGVGLQRTVYKNTNFTGGQSVTSNNMPNIGPANSCNNTLGVPGGNCKNFSAKWKGFIQPSISGSYVFDISQGLDDDATVKIFTMGGSQIYSYSATFNSHPPFPSPITLTKGQIYRIEVSYKNFVQYYNLRLNWKLPNSNSFSLVPRENLYPEDKLYLTNNNVSYQTGVCKQIDTIQAIKNNLIDSFSLIPGKKYVLSAWVKEGIAECNCFSYNGNSIEVKFNNAYSQPAFTPTGNIIEGWQRYESEFIVPANATTMQVVFNNTKSEQIFFDDFRIFPFNSNMKSFVYNPESLRLSAQLDENNYATFYEYDDEGTLIRLKKETKDGIKTIQETRSALQKSIIQF